MLAPLLSFGRWKSLTPPRWTRPTCPRRPRRARSTASRSSSAATTSRSTARSSATSSPSAKTCADNCATRLTAQIPTASLTDLIVATITLKYTQSNSVCYALRGGTIGTGAGQQSRIHCARLAGDKADAWWLRHHPRVLSFACVRPSSNALTSLSFSSAAKRADRANAIDQFVTGEIFKTDPQSAERRDWAAMFDGPAPEPISADERRAWFEQLKGRVAVSSDAFWPFSDGLLRCYRSGAGYIAAPGGSVMDKAVIEAADECGMAFAMTSLRLFHH